MKTFPLSDDKRFSEALRDFEIERDRFKEEWIQDTEEKRIYPSKLLNTPDENE